MKKKNHNIILFDYGRSNTY